MPIHLFSQKTRQETISANAPSSIENKQSDHMERDVRALDDFNSMAADKVENLL